MKLRTGLRIELQRLQVPGSQWTWVNRVFGRHGLHRLKGPRLVGTRWTHSAWPIPGERVQMHVCKIRSGLDQATAIDECSRYRGVGLFPNESATSTLAFLDRIVEDMPMSIHRSQTDRGQEVLAQQM